MLLGWKSALGRIGEISLIGFSGPLYGQVLGASAHEGYNAPVLASVAGEFQQKNKNNGCHVNAAGKPEMTIRQKVTHVVYY